VHACIRKTTTTTTTTTTISKREKRRKYSCFFLGTSYEEKLFEKCQPFPL